jgi:PAS domain S-box-containing protein/putative nucleotidyltransferase with HDIG domain
MLIGLVSVRASLPRSGEPAVEMEDKIELDPGDDRARLQLRIEGLQQEARRTKHLVDVLDVIRHTSQCAADEKGCEAFLQSVCDQLTAVGGYSSAWISFPAEGRRGPVRAEAHPPGGGGSRQVAEEDDDAQQTLAVPIAHAGRKYALLSVPHPAGFHADSSERALVEQIAAEIGLAFHNVERRQQQAAMEEGASDDNKVFRDCFEAVSVGLVLFRSYGSPPVVNKAFADFLGYEKEELERTPMTEIIAMIGHPEDHETEMALLHDVLSQRKTSLTIEKRFINKDGNDVSGLLATTYFFDRAGEFRFGICSVQDISEHVGSRQELSRAYEGAIDALIAALESRDPYTAGHQRRVTQLACAIANELGLPGKQRMGLRVASILHDIGKIAIPAEILTKPFGVSDTEYSLIRAHPAVAYDILKELQFPWPVADIVLQHHERLNGSGYPMELKAGEILLEARILAVADTVEALVSHRPYRAAISVDEAIHHIGENRYTLFDSAVVASCTRVFGDGFKFEEIGPQPRTEHLFD